MLPKREVACIAGDLGCCGRAATVQQKLVLIVMMNMVQGIFRGYSVGKFKRGAVSVKLLSDALSSPI